jgi:hypothetical protein
MMCIPSKKQANKVVPSKNTQLTGFFEKLQMLENAKSELLRNIPRTQAGFIQFTKDLEKIQNEITSLMQAIQLQQTIDTLAAEGKVQEALNAIRLKTHVRYRNKGVNTVWILFSGGHRLPIQVTYYARDCDKPGRGLYIALMLLGIENKICPQVASMVAQFCVAMSSFEEAIKMLKQQGYSLDAKQVRSIARRFSQIARRGQEMIHDVMIPKNKEGGRRIVVSIDGGRLRVRTTKRGKKTPKGRSRYHSDWKEPKIFVIYCIDENGKRCKQSEAIIDGGVYAEPEALFALLESYLKNLSITNKDYILFISDGAKWIWNRVEEFFGKLRIPKENVNYLLDFYHAVEHLKVVAEAQKNLSSNQKKRWIKRQKNQLLNGRAVIFISELKMIQQKTKDKALQSACEYFINHSEHLSYAPAKRKKYPIGSGAIESAVRRVINLRLKSAGTFWLQETANEMLFLRAYYKTNRWSAIEKMASHAIMEAVA